MEVPEEKKSKLFQITVATLVSSALGAITSISAKGLLNVVSVTLLSPGYGTVALIGAVAFASFTLGLTLYIGYKTQAVTWTSLAIGICTFLPTVWLTGLPVITAIGLLVLNIFVSCVPLLFKKFDHGLGLLPFLILRPIL